MQISDDLMLGPAVAGGSGINTDGSSQMEVGMGPMGRVYVYDIVPAALAANNLATSQNPGSGASFSLTAGAGVTSTTVNGEVRYVLDVPRAIRIVAAGANTATYLVTGYDVYGQRMTQTLAAPSTSTVTTTKAFKSIVSITNNNAAAGTNNLTVGTTDVFGLPVRVTNVAYVLNVKWDSTLAANAGTFVAAVATDPATASTGDVRGTYTPNGNASDGARRLVVAIAVPAIGCGPTATRVGAFGVTQA